MLSGKYTKLGVENTYMSYIRMLHTSYGIINNNNNTYDG